MTWRTDAASMTAGTVTLAVTREGARWRYEVRGTVGGVEVHATGYERDEASARAAAERVSEGLGRVCG